MQYLRGRQNEDTLSVAATLLTWSCFPSVDSFATRTTFVADTKNVSENLLKHFLCPRGARQCCRVLPRAGNIGRHNVTATMRAIMCPLVLAGLLAQSTGYWSISPFFTQSKFHSKICDTVPLLCYKGKFVAINACTHPRSKSSFSQPFKEKCISEVVKISMIIIFHLSKLWKLAKLFILRVVIFLVSIDSWEWKVKRINGKGLCIQPCFCWNW